MAEGNMCSVGTLVRGQSETWRRVIAPGFTLIELMTVVAIVGVLAALALPVYLDYAARSKVSEALGAAGACTTSVTEYYQHLKRMPTTTAEAGCSALSMPYVQSVAVSNGRIEVTLKAIHASKADGKILGFQPFCGAAACNPAGGDGQITAWVCDAARAATTVDASFLPSNCR